MSASLPFLSFCFHSLHVAGMMRLSMLSRCHIVLHLAFLRWGMPFDRIKIAFIFPISPLSPSFRYHMSPVPGFPRFLARCAAGPTTALPLILGTLPSPTYMPAFSRHRAYCDRMMPPPSADCGAFISLPFPQRLPFIRRERFHAGSDRN